MIKNLFKLNILILAVAISPKLFSQKLQVEFLRNFCLDSSEYSTNNTIYEVFGNEIYYATSEGSALKIFKKDTQGDKNVFFLKKNIKDYFLDFTIDSSGSFFLLFQTKLVKYQLNDENSIVSYKDIVAEAPLNLSYDNVYCTSGKIVLTRCYNYATLEKDTLFAEFSLFDRTNLQLVYTKKIVHDAIGFTHLSSYFMDVNYGKVLLVNALKNKAYIFNINERMSEDSAGDGAYLNKNISEIPFPTQIIPYTNPKAMVRDVSTFAKKIDRYEGGRFVNDSTLILVKKNKGKSINGKRTISVYQLNDSIGNWEFKSNKTFKNKMISGRYGIFNFYYPTHLKIHNNHVYLSEAYFLKTNVSKRKLKRAYMREDNLKVGLYEYFLAI
jgi:hypothetical protein